MRDYYPLLLSDCPPFGPETPWQRHLPFGGPQRTVVGVIVRTRQNTAAICPLISDPETFGGVGFEVPQAYLGDGESAIEFVFVFFEARTPSPPPEGSVYLPPSDYGLDGVIPLSPESQKAVGEEGSEGWRGGGLADVWSAEVPQRTIDLADYREAADIPDLVMSPAELRAYGAVIDDIPPLSWAEQNRRINALLMRTREDLDETDPVL